MQELVKALFEQLHKNNMMLAVAESCTGGMLSSVLTDQAGSSAYFDRGFITYSNEAKQELLNVPEKTIQTNGAVSEECAKAMAEGAFQNSKANITISITGIAGPGGATDTKPVGTVYFGISGNDAETYAIHEAFDGDRQSVRNRATQKALKLLIEHLKQA